MKFYFHLVSENKTISDDSGVEVTNLAHLRQEIIHAIDEARGNGAFDASDWQGWRLVIVSQNGDTVGSVDISVDPPIFVGPLQ